jgi:hypothetical protein
MTEENIVTATVALNRRECAIPDAWAIVNAEGDIVGYTCKLCDKYEICLPLKIDVGIKSHLSKSRQYGGCSNTASAVQKREERKRKLNVLSSLFLFSHPPSPLSLSIDCLFAVKRR